MDYTQIKYDRIGEVAWITLNRPDKLNALTDVMMAEWKSALEETTKDENCRAIVVTGEGRAWSAGVDLSMFQETKVEPGFKMYEDGMEVMRLNENCPQVTIAMLNGFCFTGAFSGNLCRIPVDTDICYFRSQRNCIFIIHNKALEIKNCV